MGTKRIVVMPDLHSIGMGAHDLYIWVRYEGDGLAPPFALDLLIQPVFDAKSPPVMPKAFELIGTRKVEINKGEGRLTFRVYRHRWDATRAPLIAGVDEPVSREPLKLAKLSDLTHRMVIFQVIAANAETETHAFQMTDQDELMELTFGQVAVAPNSDVPWYKLKSG